MKCPRCQQENAPQAKFCQECAAPLALRCANCGTQTPPGAKFCIECATPVGAPGSPARFASPETYTPKHLAERIINSKAALEGERKQVTVLFADLKGSMELLADRDPEEARKILDPVLELMMEAVHRYEGTVNQVMGDGIMALFGAPLAHEDHAVRACYAALRMQDSVKRYADELRRSHGFEVQIRVGLNSGEVVVRTIGSDLRMDYTAVGQTTHLAARMEQHSTPGSVRVTAETLRLAEGYVEVKSLGRIPIKGLPEPVEAYELVGAGVARSRMHASAARGLTRFVGRGGEVDQLRQALERAGAGHGQVVAVVGEPGVGKSRLYWEFARSHHVQGWLILESGSVSYGKATAYLPVIDLLKSYFQIEGRDDTRKIREKVTEKLLSLDRQLEPSLPAFLSLLDVPVEDVQWERFDPSQRRRHMLDGVKRLVLRESQVQPLMVIFEDLHWIDTETQALLDLLVESLPPARLLLLVSYRPEYQHGWGGRTYYRQLRVNSLPAESATDLLADLVGEHPNLEVLKGLLTERTEGNPFFLEEMVRTLVETGVLVGDRRAYQLAKNPSGVVPSTVQAIVAARIDRLPPEDKRLLQTAAVIGKNVPLRLLETIGELPDDALNQGLARLRGAEFLYETRLFPDVEYTFKHPLTHEVAYASLLREQQRTLHALIARALERLHSDRSSEHAEQLAHHAFKGELWEQAVTHCRRAGAKAYARSANREAALYFDQALAALDHLPESSVRTEQAIDLRLDLRNALLLLGDQARILGILREVEALTEVLGDQRRLGQAQSYLANCLWLLGHHAEALAVVQRALSVAIALRDTALQIPTNYRLGLIYQSLGNYREARDCLRKSITSVEEDLAYDRFGRTVLTSVSSRAWLGSCLAELGEFAEALALALEAVQIAEAADHPASLVEAYWKTGAVHLGLGELHHAVRELQRALAIGHSFHIRVQSPWVASALGYAYALSGRLQEALELLAEAAEHAVSMNLLTYQSISLVSHGEAMLFAGRGIEARRLASRALDLSRDRKERGHEAWTLRLLAEIAVDEPTGEAIENYDRARMLADELGMRPLAARCHLGLGKLYRRTGQREQAQEHLATATTMYSDMGMTYWLEKAEAEMAELE